MSDGPPDVLFRLTVYRDGTVEVWASKTISGHDFGDAVIAVGEAFRNDEIEMISGGDWP